jgi:branched-chain amino acid transport system ATP-binding protein
MQTDKPIFALEGISISFGGLQAVDDFSFEMYDGEIFSLIGPNGAGKTTVFNIINALYKPDSGSVLLEGEDRQRQRAVGGRRYCKLKTTSDCKAWNSQDISEHRAIQRNDSVGKHFTWAPFFL